MPAGVHRLHPHALRWTESEHDIQGWIQCDQCGRGCEGQRFSHPDCNFDVCHSCTEPWLDLACHRSRRDVAICKRIKAAALKQCQLNAELASHGAAHRVPTVGGGRGLAGTAPRSTHCAPPGCRALELFKLLRDSAGPGERKAEGRVAKLLSAPGCGLEAIGSLGLPATGGDPHVRPAASHRATSRPAETSRPFAP